MWKCQVSWQPNAIYNRTCLVTAITDTITWGGSERHTLESTLNMFSYCGKPQLYHHTFKLRTTVSCTTINETPPLFLHCRPCDTREVHAHFWQTLRRRFIRTSPSDTHRTCRSGALTGWPVSWARRWASKVPSWERLVEPAVWTGLRRSAKMPCYSLSAYLGDISAARSVSLWVSGLPYDIVKTLRHLVRRGIGGVLSYTRLSACN